MRIIVGNWKMHGSQAMLASLLAAVRGAAHPGAQVVVCPPATLLRPAAEALAGSPVALGAQDCHAEPEGAYTGDISAPMLKEAGCRYVIVGHSERRAHHGETNEMVRNKAQAAQAAGLIPIICIGETLAEREGGRAQAVVTEQLKSSLPANCQLPTADFLLAYEPVWAIGSGRTPTADEIHAMHAHIKAVAPGAAVLYGGSVKAANAKEILAIQGVDGVLVGGASLKAEEFCQIMAASG